MPEDTFRMARPVRYANPAQNEKRIKQVLVHICTWYLSLLKHRDTRTLSQSKFQLKCANAEICVRWRAKARVSASMQPDHDIKFPPAVSRLDFIMKTCLYNLDPLKPHFYIVKLGFTGVYIIFLISAQKHRLWVLVRTASARRF